MLSVVGGWVALIAFWVLLVQGVVLGRFSRTVAAVLVAIWAFATFGLPRLSVTAGNFSTSLVAMLDVVLVLFVNRGDVRLW